ncbi:MFS transporter [Marinomonas sp. TI.3.20]|uniref:MFS transporter n=1 Tax=Marinomonas sp. TI.3.20 TaxID=3121296 RepID=UPI00311F0DA4
MKKQTKILTAVSLAYIIIYIDISSISVVLPTLEKIFDTSQSTIIWVVNVYILARAALVFVSGKISDIFSHEKCFTFGLIVFCISSLLCGLSTSVYLLILFRVFQAIGATFLFTSGMSMITLAYPKEKRGKTIGFILSISLISMGLAPILGGLFVKYLSWRWIFYINIFIGFIIYLLLPKSNCLNIQNNKNLKFDWIGFISISTFTILLNLSFLSHSSLGWTAWSPIILFIISCLSILYFIYIEKNSNNPIIDLNIFKLPNFIPGAIISVITQITTWLILFLTIFFQKELKYTPLQTGFSLIPLFLFGIVSSNFGGYLVDRYGFKIPLILGTGSSLFGVILFFLFDNLTYLKMIPMLVFTGIGMFMINGPIRAAMLNQTTKDKYGMVNSTLNGLRSIGGAIGFSVLNTILFNAEFYHAKFNLEYLFTNIKSDKVHDLIGLLSNTPESLTILNQYPLNIRNDIFHIISSSYLYGFYWMIGTLSILMIINFMLSIFFIKDTNK